MLEYFVHVDKDDAPTDLVLAIAEVPDDLARERVEAASLPATWRESAAPPELTRLGDEFVKRGEHCVLLVPSVLAPHENNCLINPAHPDYKKIMGFDLEALNYDSRMFRERRRHRRR
jgi:RES domain-containing protein